MTRNPTRCVINRRRLHTKLLLPLRSRSHRTCACVREDSIECNCCLDHLHFWFQTQFLKRRCSLEMFLDSAQWAWCFKDSCVAMIYTFHWPLIFLALAALYMVWRLWRFTIIPALYPQEPKETPYWFPSQCIAGFILESAKLHF